jgi:diguanylate cyclase
MMMQRLGIRLRLFLAAGLPALLAIMVLLQGFLSHHDRVLEQSIQRQALVLARQVASSAELALFARDLDGLQHLAWGGRQSDSLVAAISILAPDRRLLVAEGSAMGPSQAAALESGIAARIGERMVALAEIRSTVLEDFGMSDAAHADRASDQRRLLGYVLVEIELSPLQQQRRQLLNWALLVAASSLLVAGLLSVAIASSVTRPLQRITAVVARIREGQLGARVNPRRTGVLQALGEGINSMADRLAEHEQELQQLVLKATDDLRRQKEAAERSARIDPLTGLLNRRAFKELAEREIQRARRFLHPMSLIVVDLDRFKSINDCHGHLVGDAVLEDFARVASAQLRALDVIARLGGEEFVVLLPGTNTEGALQLAERMRQAIADSRLALEGQVLGYTASFGIAAFEPRQPGLDRWLARADAALYEAKAKGRNRVELASAWAEQERQL